MVGCPVETVNLSYKQTEENKDRRKLTTVTRRYTQNKRTDRAFTKRKSWIR